VHPVPLLIISCYLAAVTALGVLLGRWSRTDRDWAIAGRGLGVMVLAGGIAGTRIGGAGTYGVAGDVIAGGIWHLVWYALSTFLAIAIVGLFFARTYRRLELQTTSEIFWRRFRSTRCQVVTSLSVQTLYLAVNVIEPYVIGALLQSLTGMPLAAGIAIGAVILVSYTTLGGLWGAVVTNLIHSVVIIVGFALVAVLGVAHLGGWAAMQAAIDLRLAEAGRDGASWWSPVGGGWVAALGMAFAAVIHSPAASIYANFSSAARSPRTIVPSFLLGAAAAAAMPLFAGIIGMQALARYGIAAGPKGYASITAMALEISPWIGGVALAGVLAAVVSSGGPVLLASAMLLVRDCVPRSRGWSPARRLAAYRTATVGFGILGACLAWVAARHDVSLMRLLIVGFGMLVPPGIAIAFLLYWRRTTEAGAFWGMALGYGSAVVWYLAAYERTGIYPSHPATLIPLLVIPIVSLATAGQPQAEAMGAAADIPS
jgi:SSS family solute:Na+ symporter